MLVEVGLSLKVNLHVDIRIFRWIRINLYRFAENALPGPNMDNNFYVGGLATNDLVVIH